MATFKELRQAIFKTAGVKDHFEFISLSLDHKKFHDAINKAEFDLGYSKEYVEGFVNLCDMELLSEKDFADWLERFRAISKK